MTYRSDIDLIACPECEHVWLGDWEGCELQNPVCPSCLAVLTDEELGQIAEARCAKT